MPDEKEERETIKKASISNKTKMCPIFDQSRAKALYAGPRPGGYPYTLSFLRIEREEGEADDEPENSYFYYVFMCWNLISSTVMIVEPDLKTVRSNEEFHGLNIINTSDNLFNGHLLAFDNE